MTPAPLPFSVPSTDVLGDLFASLPIGVIALTADSRVVVFNEHEEKLAGRKRERVLGRRFFEEIAPCMNVRELGGKFRDHVHEATLDETIEFSFPFPTVAQPRDVVVRMRSFIAGGEPHAMLLVEDVSMQRSLERMRETLASLLVHDMKSPLTAVIGNVEYVADELGEGASPFIRDALSEAVVGGRRLNRMILNLLDVTRLETGTFPLARAPADVGAIVAEAAASAASLARMRDVTIVLSPETPSLAGTVDAEALRRALDNLMDNAIRHAALGGRVVIETGTESGRLVIDVVDDGPGIPADQRPYVFDKYGQSQSGASRSNQGLGLTFVRMAARAHGGDVVIVDDGRPHGARFRMTLPVDAPKPERG